MAQKLDVLVNRSVKDLRNMTEKEIRQDLGRMRDAAHKRIQRHKEAGTTPKSIKKVVELGEISTKGKTPDELIAEYQRAQKILKAGGVREVKKKREAKRAREKGQAQKPKKEESKVNRIRGGWREPELYDVQTAYERLKKKEEREEKRRQKREAIDKFLKDTEINPSDAMQKMKKDELKTIYKLLREETKKRMREFEKVGESSPAYRAIKDQLPAKMPIDRNELLSIVARMRKFINSSTGTVSQWIEEKRNIIHKLRAGGVTSINGDNFDMVFKIYEELKEQDPRVAVLNYKSDTLQIIGERVNKIIYDNVDILAILDEYYEEMQKEKNKELDEILKLDDKADTWDGFNPFDE